MAVLISSDWHLNDNPRDRYRHEWQARLHQLIHEHSVHCLVFLGDLTDEKNNHSAALVNTIINHLSKLHDICPRIIMMRGNHDYEDPSCPFFRFVEAMPGFEWVNTPTTLYMKGLGGGGNALFLPHTHDYKREWANLDKDFEHADFIFAHNTFAGAIGDSGHVLSGIPTTVFPIEGVPVVSGDIHKPQQVDCVTYVGSPYTIDFGDNFTPRVLLSAGDELRSIKCDGPQKRLVQATGVKQALAKLEDAKDDIIKLRIAVSAADKDNWPTTKRQLLEEANKLGVRVHAIEPILEQPDVARRYRVSSGKAQRDDEVLKAYCKQQGVEADREKTGLAIMKG